METSWGIMLLADRDIAEDEDDLDARAGEARSANSQSSFGFTDERPGGHRARARQVPQASPKDTYGCLERASGRVPRSRIN